MSSAGTQEFSMESFTYSLPPDLEQAVDKARKSWEEANGTERLWKKDASLWTNTDESKWLGWLDIVDAELGEISKFKALAAEIQEDGFTHLLLLGMGGSSLCPEVFSLTFKKQPNAPELLILDSTDPQYIQSIRSKIDPVRTLFCVSSKSGTTLEPNIYMQYFYEETRKVVGDRAGQHFIAVTDPGSKLEGVAAKLGFRRVYHGVPGIGGRYSALSDFGLVPHAAMGLDTENFLKRTKLMVDLCKSKSGEENPGVALGLILGVAAAQFRRDKVTLFCSHSIYDLGAWLEQLLAESTGKEGRGLIPVDREPIPKDNLEQVYGNDRIFAYIKFADDRDAEIEETIAALETAKQPVIRIVLPNLQDIGQTFFQWEIATAVAGSIIGINAFNQPDVEASKVVTRDLTSAFEKSGSLPPEQPILDQDGIKLFTDDVNAKNLLKGGKTLGAVIREQLDRLHPGDYFGLLAYIPMFPEYEDKLQNIRERVLESKHVATVLGFGPRFLHSTGQAYKGGPNSGVFLQITCDDAADLPVPEQKYTFGIVKAAQARGDFQVLADRHRRALRIHLGEDISSGLDRLSDLVSAALAH
ncbi:MAG TPA: bifunctional transaldolase/phosoglucose isomerase [Bryobacteraceae bacterium]|jgi:glucose-6-phosphate isomerase|nr:bifunctional transaldolase/phosoglucose isomerase [Bryobacteraceae bacterium]